MRKFGVVTAALAASVTATVLLSACVGPSETSSSDTGQVQSETVPVSATDAQAGKMIAAAETINAEQGGKWFTASDGTVEIRLRIATPIYPGMDSEMRDIIDVPLPLKYAVQFQYSVRGEKDDDEAAIQATLHELGEKYDVPLFTENWEKLIVPTVRTRSLTAASITTPAQSDSRPGQVIYPGNGQFVCTAGAYGSFAGAGATSKVMFTAAHCGGDIVDWNQDRYGKTVRQELVALGGGIDPNGPGDFQAVRSSGTHSTLLHNGKNIPIVGVASSKMLRQGATVCRTGAVSGTNCLLVVDMKTFKGDVAQRTWLTFRTRAPGKSAVATGDSGGPVYVMRGGKAYLAGIQSAGMNCELDAKGNCLQVTGEPLPSDLCWGESNCFHFGMAARVTSALQDLGNLSLSVRK